jgi:hypothetical protein
MAYPKKKAAKKTASPRKRKAPAKEVKEDARQENMAQFLWVLCALVGSEAVFNEVQALRGAYRKLKPAAKQELRTIAAQVVLGLQSVHRLVRRERLESGTGKR